MRELEILKSQWSSKTTRTTQLIVPEITYTNRNGSLNNCSWAYNVEYAFRAALDIKYEQRMKNKTPYMVWTQGPFINFKNGDIIHSQNKTSSLQVILSTPMSWSNERNEMYEGYVQFNKYAYEDNSLALSEKLMCSQMQFLEILIYGNIAVANQFVSEQDLD